MNAPFDPSVGLENTPPGTPAAFRPDPDDAESAPREREVVGPIQVVDFDLAGDHAAAAATTGDEPGHVEAVALSPDGRLAAAASADGKGATVAVRTAGEEFAAKAAKAEATAEKLIDALGHHLKPGMKPEVQKETAALISLISDLAYEEFTEFFPLVRVAVQAVTVEPPNLTLAQQIRRDIRRRTNLFLRPLLFLRTGHPAVQVILGLSTNLYLAIPIALLLLPQAVRGTLFPGNHDQTFILVAVAGAVGSIVSMLVRIKDFDNEEAEHRAILFFTGFFKPVIGVASALFMVLILEAGLIPIGIENTDTRTFFFLAIAFVAGFSERLASDIVTEAEGRLKKGSPAPDPQAKG